MDLSFDPTYPFGSEQALNEYSMLSAILGNPSSESPSANDVPSPMVDSSPGQMPGWPTIATSPTNLGVYPPPLPPELTRASTLGTSTTPTSRTTSSNSYMLPIGSTPPSLSDAATGLRSSSVDMIPADFTSGQDPSSGFSNYGSSSSQQQHQQSLGNRAGGGLGQWRPAGDSVYDSVVSGYDYTQGYHFLMRFLSERSAVPFPFLNRNASTTTSASAPHAEPNGEGGYRSSVGSKLSMLGDQSRQHHPFPPPNSSSSSSSLLPTYSTSSQESDSTVNSALINQWTNSPPPPRFDKNDILRVVRALAIFRPSLIALQMPMSQKDEIFVERALQRSLLVRLLID